MPLLPLYKSEAEQVLLEKTLTYSILSSLQASQSYNKNTFKKIMAHFYGWG